MGIIPYRMWVLDIYIYIIFIYLYIYIYTYMIWGNALYCCRQGIPYAYNSVLDLGDWTYIIYRDDLGRWPVLV